MSRESVRQLNWTSSEINDLLIPKRNQFIFVSRHTNGESLEKIQIYHGNIISDGQTDAQTDNTNNIMLPAPPNHGGGKMYICRTLKLLSDIWFLAMLIGQQEGQPVCKNHSSNLRKFPQECPQEPGLICDKLGDSQPVQHKPRTKLAQYQISGI